MWQPDGAGRLARIGVLTPHIDPVPESELNAMAPEGISIHAARVPLGMVGPDGEIIPRVGPDVARAFAEPPAVDDAAALLSAAALNVIIFAFTSSSYILGPAADAELKIRLEKRTGGTPVVISTAAVVAALRAVGAQRFALIHPPWYTSESDRLGVEYFRNQGFDVVHHGAAALRSDFGEIHPEQIYEWVKAHVPSNADAVFIGGNGFRAIGAIQALESDLGCPTLCANQVAFWYALRLAGIRAGATGYGRLFSKDLPDE